MDRDMEKIISLPFPFALRLRGGQRAWPWPGPGRPRPGSRPDSCRAGTEDHGGIPAVLLTAGRQPELERSGSAPGSGTCGVHRDRYRGRSTQAVPGADRGLEVRSHAGLPLAARHGRCPVLAGCGESARQEASGDTYTLRTRTRRPCGSARPRVFVIPGRAYLRPHPPGACPAVRPGAWSWPGSRRAC